MGTVYLASTPGGRLVAVKLIRPELAADDEFQERFRLEVRAARRVRGLYTAELLDADLDDSCPWLVTAYVPGPSLAHAVKTQGPVPPELVPLLMAGVAEALLEIHSAGIVHRDLKASNVLLSPDGPRVIDFGIAKALDTSRLTMSGAAMGSPECMTPEQVQGLPVTRAADIFALGSLCTFAATARSPFAAPNSAAMMYRVLHEAPVLDGIPAELRELIEHCFAKNPDERPSPAEVLERCRALMPDGTAVFPQSWRQDADGGQPGADQAEQLVSIGEGWSPAPSRPPARTGTPPMPDDAWFTPVTEREAPSGDLASFVSSLSGQYPIATATRAETYQAAPAQAVAEDAGPAKANEPEPAPEPTPAPRPSRRVAAWLMYGASAMAVATLAVGLATVPSLRAASAQEHPGSGGSAAAAVNLALVVLILRALTIAGAWLWAALDTASGQRRARTITSVAFAVSTLGLASSALGMSTAVVQYLTTAGWLVALAAIAVARVRRLPLAVPTADQVKIPAAVSRIDY